MIIILSSLSISLFLFLYEKNLQKIPVYEKEPEQIIGILHFKDLLLHSDLPIRRLLKPPVYVPEQKKLESLLEFFRTQRIDFALAAA